MARFDPSPGFVLGRSSRGPGAAERFIKFFESRDGLEWDSAAIVRVRENRKPDIFVCIGYETNDTADSC